MVVLLLLLLCRCHWCWRRWYRCCCLLLLLLLDPLSHVPGLPPPRPLASLAQHTCAAADIDAALPPNDSASFPAPHSLPQKADISIGKNGTAIIHAVDRVLIPGLGYFN